LHKKETIEPVSIIETPPITVIGLVGYIETPRGLRALATVWASKFSKDTLRRFYKNWMQSKKKAFTKYHAKVAENAKNQETQLKRITKYCSIVRAIAHTNMNKLNFR
jgi:large subunit ribosomal protein L3e